MDNFVPLNRTIYFSTRKSTHLDIRYKKVLIYVEKLLV